jgi:hypothetical protein
LEARLEGDLYPRRAIISGLVTAKKAEVKGNLCIELGY